MPKDTARSSRMCQQFSALKVAQQRNFPSFILAVENLNSLTMTHRPQSLRKYNPDMPRDDNKTEGLGTNLKHPETYGFPPFGI